MSIAVGLGLSELFRQRNARAVAVALLLLLLGDTALGVLRGDPAGWTLVLLAGVTAVFACAGWLPERWRGLAPAGLYLAFLALDWISLYWYVVPALQPVGGS